MNRLLLLEDDVVLSKEIREFLQLRNVTCDAVFDGEVLLKNLAGHKCDMYLLDIQVPGVHGIEVCRRIRQHNPRVPILMLTAFGEIQDKREAFQWGADDYLVKPFHLEELYIRVQALLRRAQLSVPSSLDVLIEVGELTIDTEAQQVTRAGQPITLTPKEYQILLFLAKAQGRVLSKQLIAEGIWDQHYDTNPNTIEVYINFLRNKIDKPFGYKIIHTKPGFGYYLSDTP